MTEAYKKCLAALFENDKAKVNRAYELTAQALSYSSPTPEILIPDQLLKALSLLDQKTVAVNVYVTSLLTPPYSRDMIMSSDSILKALMCVTDPEPTRFGPPRKKRF